jgi:tRNA threonylcarbamoyladenosine biosynthesis protein TsaB
VPILCLDTATATARVAVMNDEGTALLAARDATAPRHSSHVLRLCDEVLAAAAVSPSALRAIACGAGPGSFTGLRVGLAVAKGLAMPSDVPLVMVSSLQALALDVYGTLAPAASDASAGAVLVAACLDAGKGEVHVGLFARDETELVVAVEPPRLVRPAALPAQGGAGSASVVLAGNGADRYQAELVPRLPASWRWLAVGGPTAGSIGRLGALRLQRGGAADLERAVPDYGRGPDITVKKRPDPIP